MLCVFFGKRLILLLDYACSTETHITWPGHRHAQHPTSISSLRPSHKTHHPQPHHLWNRVDTISGWYVNKTSMISQLEEFCYTGSTDSASICRPMSSREHVQFVPQHSNTLTTFAFQVNFPSPFSHHQFLVVLVSVAVCACSTQSNNQQLVS